MFMNIIWTIHRSHAAYINWMNQQNARQRLRQYANRIYCGRAKKKKKQPYLHYNCSENEVVKIRDKRRAVERRRRVV